MANTASAAPSSSQQEEKKAGEPHSSCCVCGSSSKSKVFDKGGLDYLRCDNCGLVMVHPLPTPAQLEEFYDEDYKEHGMGTAMVVQEEMARATARYRLGRVRRYASGENWLDVGCSTGLFMDEAQKAGLKAEGIDLSRSAVEQARGRNLKAHMATVEDFAPETLYDTVTGFDVIEHVLDPNQFLQGVTKLLKPCGILALTTPDTDSLTGRLMGKRWYFYIPIVHTFHFNRSNIAQLLSQHGFEVVEISRAGKALTYDYSLVQFQLGNPFIYRIWWLCSFLIPRPVRKWVFRVPIGEMMVIARKNGG